MEPVVDEEGESESDGVRDPFAELARLAREFVPEPVVGDIWWLPRRHIGSLKRPPNDAFCLLAVPELDRNGDIALFHFVAGSTTPSKALTIRVDPSKDGLAKTTYFRFWRAGSLAPATIASDGEWRERLAAERLPEINDVIRTSNLTYLRGIVDG